jgi:hypothetical protein
MKIKISVILALLVLVSVGLVLSEDSALPQATSVPVPQENSEANTQWVWGEVVNVDSPGKALTLKYLDYETDQEKELSLSVDDATIYQNFKSLDEIQPKNNLSVDYILKDGKNIAKSINLETSESAPSPEIPQAVVVAPTEKLDNPETAAKTNQ